MDDQVPIRVFNHENFSKPSTISLSLISLGVKVRALFDYEAAESDELEFKSGKTTCCIELNSIIFYLCMFVFTGETFEKLEDEDSQGWCKGRKDGKVGLYPANYVEVID